MRGMKKKANGYGCVMSGVSVGRKWINYLHTNRERESDKERFSSRYFLYACCTM